MSEDLHQTNAANNRGGETQENWFLDGVKKALPTIIFGILAAAFSSYYTSHQSQQDLAREVEAIKKENLKNAENHLKLAENYSQLLIAFTKMSENQIRMAQDVQGVQDRERQRLEAQANRR